MKISKRKLRRIIREEARKMLSEDRVRTRDRVLIKPVRKYGTVKGRSDSERDLWWVDFEDEYGGKYWYESDLEVIDDRGYY